MRVTLSVCSSGFVVRVLWKFGSLDGTIHKHGHSLQMPSH